MCDYKNCCRNAQLQMPYVNGSLNMTNEHNALMFCNRHYDFLKMIFLHYKYAEIGIGNKILHTGNDGKYIIKKQSLLRQKEIVKNLNMIILWRQSFIERLKLEAIQKLNVQTWIQHLELLMDACLSAKL